MVLFFDRARAGAQGEEAIIANPNLAGEEGHHYVLEVLADCLDYPTAALTAQLGTTISRLGLRAPYLSRLLIRFKSFLEKTPPEGVEEIYSETFDLEPDFCLYVGYHLFRDARRRSFLMAKLEKCYRASHFSRGQELPDHLSVLIRFVAATMNKTDEAGKMIDYCIAPAVRRIIGRLETANPYLPVMQALQITLQANKRNV